MKPFSALLAISVALMIGCGSHLDNDPTVLGFSPSLRAEMRELIAADNPSADPEQVVQAYMVEVRKLAQGLQIKPNASGDYVYPQEQEAMLDKWRTSRGVLEVTNEFSPDLPHWADPLLEEYRTGNITPEREELLLRVVFFEVTSQLAG